MNAMIRSPLSSARNPWIEAPRRVWLATLGAAAVTRRWAGSGAAPMFRSLVRQGEELETLVLRDVGARVRSSMKHARRLAAGAQQVAGQSLQRFVRRPGKIAQAAGTATRSATRGATRATPRAKKGSTRKAATRGGRASRRAAA